MSKFVYYRHRRPTSDHGIQVEFFKHRTAILDQSRLHDLKIAEFFLGLGPSMSFDYSYDDINALFAKLMSILEHLIGLADTCSGTNIHPQLGLLVVLKPLQDRLGRRTRARFA